MKYNKKGQFLILSVMFILIAGVIIYSQETINTYKSPESDYYIINSLEKEVCGLLRNTNGSNLPSVINNTQNDTKIYCENINSRCQMDVINTTQVPYQGNWSRHNYTHYNYTLIFESQTLEYDEDLRC